MRRAPAAAFGVLLLGVTATSASGQGSVFAVKGLGWAGRPVSARTAGTGGAFAAVDPAMSLNPAALTRWRSVAAWAVGAPSRRSFEGPTGSAEQQTVRFPLFGFAAAMPRLVVGFSISDYLDRTYTLVRSDSSVCPGPSCLRGTTEKFTDATRSIGGVSDLSLGAGYRLTPTLSVGAGVHYYLGSTRFAAQRTFENTAYEEILEQSLTDFRGAGVAAGLMWSPRNVDVSASARLNGRLRSNSSTGAQEHTRLPAQLAFGLRLQAVPGVFIAGNAQYDGWGVARNIAATGPDSARNVWSFAIGAEVQSVNLLVVHTPLRLGYRTRTLPFTSGGDAIREHAFAGGIGLNLARDRTTLDISFETGSRTAGAAKETFQSLFVGVTVRP